jgi:hypothetical protein
MPTRLAAAGLPSALSAPVGPLPHDPSGVAVILDPLDGFEDACDAAAARVWAEFESFLTGALREGWRPTTPARRGACDVLAESRLHRLTLTVGVEGWAHVGVTPRRDLGPGEADLARRTLDAAASVIFDRLATRWRLRIRSGPYATAPWRPHRLKRGAAADDHP